ncbi:ferredoxin ['Osedax' symbiont bacterium Rs2_46_30_T18]|nr:ferredoxin ['Osedax' symbiont bacterium Rs2_46_30_T18]
MNVEFYPLTVSKISRLCPGAVAINFKVEPHLQELFKFHQGQHLIIEANISGEKVRRSYSISVATDSPELQVGIKKINNGVFSNFANEQLQVGDTLQVMPPQGHFHTDLDPGQKKHYALIAAGSGITPMLSIAESVLATEPDARVTLIFSNKTTQSMMFKERLSFLKNRYMSRFSWVNVFSREEQEAEVLHGRLSAEKMQSLQTQRLIDMHSFDECFLCGPHQMVKSVEQALLGAGIDATSIHYELFYAGDEVLPELSAEQKADKSIKQVIVKSGGRKLTLELTSTGIDILDSAMQHGLDLPFSCKGGVCATCKAKVISGEVRMDRNHCLTDKELAQGMILTCQSHPVSDRVEVNFDV